MGLWSLLRKGSHTVTVILRTISRTLGACLTCSRGQSVLMGVVWETVGVTEGLPRRWCIMYKSTRPPSRLSLVNRITTVWLS